MSEPIPTKFTIGGGIPMRLLPRLCRAIEAQGLACSRADMAEVPADAAEARRQIEQAAADHQVAVFYDNECNYGVMDDLEAFCTSHGVDFDRHCDAKYEYNAELLKGRGRRQPVSVASNQDAEELVLVREIRDILANNTRYRPLQMLDQLRKLLVAIPPALAPVTLVAHGPGQVCRQEENPVTADVQSSSRQPTSGLGSGPLPR